MSARERGPWLMLPQALRTWSQARLDTAASTSLHEKHLLDAADYIEALEAERDAAVSRYEAMEIALRRLLRAMYDVLPATIADPHPDHPEHVEARDAILAAEAILDEEPSPR